MTDLVKIKGEINDRLANVETMNSLIETTFKGLTPQNVKRAMMEGIMRGFTFEDFLEKNVYAIPFKGGYSLIVSIDYVRKIGMRSGVVGKTAPVFVEQEKKIESCSVTVKRKVNEYVGDYTATVYFDEYYKAGRNGYPSQWDSKPHTMIAKVAEMHALRMACPEELSQMYVEEEMQKPEVITIDFSEHEAKLRESETIEDLKENWLQLPAEAKLKLGNVKEEVKMEFTNPNLEFEAKVAEIKKGE